mmetsp:Transcript_16085/g.20403  ORF Transcript_16085/g.20403 Transcript_16085/m.20403 type:complete len:324 (+) Transcript_16085:125-1096(+)|eukprot:CAMPEP_0203658466 /NCGR_PEP_ID=MMETSP0088-20131115/48283_1 /ASSEMBLY_ACC=CAM_ASM_001087 /TAXON_ID=426623 /ORGANISM="Chaetoceros affinis, Strain CCMP159" /LENGTH=323 /DNA_ID=CAMNT_0050520143 /DNA_START=60 /DNA_END=1031 /DNA_ORIENTATION=-
MDLIEFCYGPDTTIYEMLRINEDAQHKDIQLAFTERRMELYRQLQTLNEDSADQLVVVKSKGGKGIQLSEKTLVEKKMDALVSGFRVLADPRKRRRYDAKLNKSRSKRKPRSPVSKFRESRNVQKERSSPKSVLDHEDPPSVEEHEENWLPGGLRSVEIESNDSGVGGLNEDASFQASPKAQGALKKGKKGDISTTVALKDGMSMSASESFSRAGSYDTTTTNKSFKSGISKTDSEDEDIKEYYQRVVSKRETGLGSWLRSKNLHSHANNVDNVSNEIVGSAADLWLSISQVFSAFSIDDEAIDAISGDITKASRDLHSGKYM